MPTLEVQMFKSDSLLFFLDCDSLSSDESGRFSPGEDNLAITKIQMTSLHEEHLFDSNELA